jgi:Nucleotide modification associated domain 5
MKLTKYDRQAFVKAVLADIPQIDYREQARKLIYEDSIDQLPKVLQDAARDEKAKSYIHTTSHYLSAFYNSFTVFGQRYHDYKPSDKIKTKLGELIAAHEAQKEKLDAVEAKLTASIEACTTLKSAKERLPEFEKYLPADRTPEKGVYLPAVANLVADLATLGWPKDKVAPKEEAKRGKKTAAVVTA